MLNVIINTCCESADPLVAASLGSYGTGAAPYSHRAANLADMIEAYRLQPEVQVTVVGEYHHGSGYVYLHEPGKTRSPEDQAQQRARGQAFVRNGTLGYTRYPTLFLNDDHYLPVDAIPELLDFLRSHPTVDLVAFRRVDTTGRALLTGWPSYIHGHGHAVTPRGMDLVSWADVEPTLGIGTGRQADLQFTALVWASPVNVEQAPIALVEMDGGDFPW